MRFTASQLDSYADCPRFTIAQKFPYLLQGFKMEQMPTWIGAPIGSGIHSGAEHLLRQKQNGVTDPLLSLPKAITLAIGEFDKRVIRENPKFTRAVPDTVTAHAKIKKYVTSYAELVLPHRSVNMIETRFTKKLMGGRHEISAKLDLYTGEGKICDLKTGDRSTPHGARAQVGLQAWLLRDEEHGVSGAQVDVLNDGGKGGAMQAYSYNYDVDNSIIYTKEILGRMMRDIAAFQSNGKIFVFGTNPGSSMCNKFMCPLFGTSSCSAWQL